MSDNLQPDTENIEFELESWEDIKSKAFDLLSSGEEKKRIFEKLGYKVLKSGELLNLKTNKKVKVKGKDDEFINVKKSSLALISGSHNFVRNVAEYSDLLVEKGELNFTTKDNSLTKD